MTIRIEQMFFTKINKNKVQKNTKYFKKYLYCVCLDKFLKKLSDTLLYCIGK